MRWKMVGRKAIPVETIAYITYKEDTSVKELLEETGVARSHIYYLWKEPVGTRRLKNHSRKGVGGRPFKPTKWDKRRILRLIKKSRHENPNWTARRMMERMDITDICQNFSTIFEPKRL